MTPTADKDQGVLHGTQLHPVMRIIGACHEDYDPAPVLGYQTHKGGPVISLGDKENIIVGDDADADGDDVEDLYRISVERNRVDNDDDDAARSRAPIRNGLDRFGGKQEPHDERKLVGLVMSLSERVAALQHTLGNIKLQNHYIYRTIKKGYKSCKESANDSAIKVGR
ncbi:hypothetical protein LSH36_233g02020 [Paralvinella palmiformis]|uniref:Uncharacterized protein n=1 Tax=Paralvinella palmiformis TaxID=53620 RepID=A0AAD9JM08_9ANNE|nr:hypothetical protein LSH36_233g02020 [Paralvinella palmiformis]